uniref:Uncharacterized protein n=1 Tax=Panagrolaimus sp. ES5 TaxID=591445 RepID=A0AC34FKB1_9BILA
MSNPTTSFTRREMLTPPPELSIPKKSLQMFPFNSERFVGRLGGGDFDRIDRLEGSKKEDGNSKWQKIPVKKRVSTDDSEPID